MPSAAETNIVKRVINGPVLSALHWLMSVSTIHPSLHRFKNAFGLTVGMVAGDTGLGVLTGYHADGTAVNKNHVPGVFKPFHNMLHYQYHSDEDSERYKRAAHIWTIIGLGGVGAFMGSHDYALNDQPIVRDARKAFEDPKKFTLNFAEDLHVARQSEVWRKMSGISSTIGSSGGLQLMPGVTNYGTDLSMSFLGTVRRNKTWMPGMRGLQKLVTGSPHPYPMGPVSLLERTKNLLLHSPDAEPKHVRPMVEAALDIWFDKRATPERVDAFLKPLLDAHAKVYKPGGVPKAAQAELEKTLTGLLTNEGLEKHLLSAGLDPTTAMIGRGGMMEHVPRWIGGEASLKEVEAQFRKGYAMRHGAEKVVETGTERVLNAVAKAADTKMVKTGAGLMAGMMAAVGITAWVQRNSLKKYQHVDTPNPEADFEHDAYDKTKPRKYLEALETVTNMVNMPSSFGLHRSACALGLTFGGYIGTQVGNVVAGRTLTNQPMPVEKVPEFLKPLYNIMPYNPMSDHVRDKWRFVAHFAIPAVLGVAGVMAASNLFFNSRKKQVQSADYIDEYEKKISMAEGNAYTPLVAAFAFPVAPSPFAYTPMTNYGSMLASRFMLTSGRKVVTPGIGKWWTNSTSRFPQGPAELIDVMIDYVTDTPARHPEQLRDMVVGILPQWFPNVTPQQIDEFVKMVEEDRAKYCKDGAVVPDDIKESCRDALKAHFKGAGLEERLREIHLNPMEAIFGNNGLCSTIGNKLGAQKEVDELRAEFQRKYATRLAKAENKAEPAPAPAAPKETETPSTEASLTTLAQSASHAARVMDAEQGTKHYVGA